MLIGALTQIPNPKPLNPLISNIKKARELCFFTGVHTGFKIGVSVQGRLGFRVSGLELFV